MAKRLSPEASDLVKLRATIFATRDMLLKYIRQEHDLRSTDVIKEYDKIYERKLSMFLAEIEKNLDK